MKIEFTVFMLRVRASSSELAVVCELRIDYALCEEREQLAGNCLTINLSFFVCIAIVSCFIVSVVVECIYITCSLANI